jgi:hypothetical protein
MGQNQTRVWEKRAEQLTRSGRVELLEVRESGGGQLGDSTRQALRYRSPTLQVPIADLGIDDDLIRASVPGEVCFTLVAPMTEGTIAEPDGDRPSCR